MRTSVEIALAWIDESVRRLRPEEVELTDAVGRAVAKDALASIDVPPFDRAAIDGIAVRAEEVTGASAYNPLCLQPCSGTLLSAGDPIPPGCDAIVPLAYIEPDATGGFEVIQEVAAGSGIERRAGQCHSGAVLLKQGQPLIPHHIGLLAEAGVRRVHVVQRPIVRCILLGRDCRPHDPNGALLRALIARDGGSASAFDYIGRDFAAIRDALADQLADLIVIVGGTGPGSNDCSAEALAAAGELAIHGIALRPGETAGLGRLTDGVVVCLLPGAPAACLWAYEFLAGRAVRILSGRNPALPFHRRRMTTIRKLVSVIGLTEIIPVRFLGGDRVEPIISFAEIGLAAATRAGGFVVIAEGSEGIAESTLIDVHLFEGRDPSGDDLRLT
jgi:molybdopterin molybdotransferase